MGYITGGLVMGTMLTGMFKWVYDFNVVKKHLHFKRLPSAFDGFKMVQISDLHLGSWDSQKPLEEAVKIINNLNPDIVLFTGDLVNFSTREAFRFASVLKQIKAPYGVYCTLGNHDYGDYVSWPSKAAKQKNMSQLYHLYKEMGWKLMNNQHTLLEKDGEQIALVGVENWGAHARFPKRGDIKKATQGLNENIFKILMSHDPTHWDYVIVPENYDIDLTLSGHTHGFQFGIETKGLKWSPAQYLYKEWAGLYKDALTPRQIYVNRGLGSIGYPGRIGILPEITLFQLKSEA
jgi:predicted MPP superfamily phosphohydrolase